MNALREAGERLVAAAKPRFKDFRVDFEKVSNAASKAARDGREGLSAETAFGWFSDEEWNLRLPLQRRYAEAGAYEAIAKYHMVRFKNYLGRNAPWPDSPAWATLTLFADHGRADLGVALARTYVDMQFKRLKRDYSARNPRGSRVPRAEGIEKAILAIGKAIAGAIPDRKAELLRDIDSLAPYIDAHGSDEDRAWFESIRREIWMERRSRSGVEQP